MKLDFPKYVRLFLLILFSTAFILGFTKFGTFAYESVFATAESFRSNTSIGSVSVDGLSTEEAKAKLEKAVVEWKQGNPLLLSYGDQKVTVPSGKIDFFIEESVSAAESGVNNPLLAEVSQNEVSSLLSQLTSAEIMAAVKIKALKKEIETQAGWLGTQEHIVRIADFFSPESVMSEDVLASATMQTRFISELAEPTTISIKPYTKFSFLNEFAANYPSWSEDMLTVAASALYEASLQTNMQIIERQISHELPNGIQKGFEAKVKREEIDLIMENPNDFPLQLTFQANENSSLSVEITGYPLGKRYEIRLTNANSYPFRKIVQYAPLAPLGSETVKKAGINGSSVTVYRDIFAANGKKLETEKVSDDFYFPVHQIVVRPFTSSTDTAADTTDSATNEDAITQNDSGKEETQTEDVQRTEETKTEDKVGETKTATDTN